MPLLDACLAFALTMLSLATIATLGTEMFVRLMNMRAKGLQLMLDDLFEKEVLPTLRQQADEIDWQTLKTQCAAALQKSPLADMAGASLWKQFLKATAEWLGLTKVTNLDFDEFLKRLPDTELGRKVVGLAEEQRRALFDRLSHRYEEFGSAVRNLFARYAQIFSLLVGVIVAFAMNVDSFRLFTALQEDASLRGRVIASSDQIFTDWEKAQKQEIDRKAAEGKPQPDLTREQLQKQKQEFFEQWKRVNSLDLPIGYDHFPRMDPSTVSTSNLGALCQYTRFYGCWALQVLISGLLIGLGGPFWYNVATKLMEVTQSFRSGAVAESATVRRRSLTRQLDDYEHPADDLFMKFANRTQPPAP